jgi:hypothetical protein
LTEIAARGARRMTRGRAYARGVDGCDAGAQQTGARIMSKQRLPAIKIAPDAYKVL